MVRAFQLRSPVGGAPMCRANITLWTVVIRWCLYWHRVPPRDVIVYARDERGEEFWQSMNIPDWLCDQCMTGDVTEITNEELKEAVAEWARCDTRMPATRFDVWLPNRLFPNTFDLRRRPNGTFDPHGDLAVRPRAHECEPFIVAVIRAAGRRLKTDEVVDALEDAGHPYGVSVVKQALARMTKPGRELDNRRDARGKGYGLREWVG